ncbi:MAG TPA: AraC family transcriptional regulator, partial [Polyangiaceae bacterium]|nr:AraC family transcriptional regulator [Polyangiaceae bacterium]
AILITGPFATARPTSAEILERWRGLSGRQGNPADPEFSDYVAATLDTLVLSAGHAKLFERFAVCVARLLAGDGDPRALLDEAEPLRDELERSRSVDRMWAAARSMVDPRTSRSWSSPHRVEGLANMGLSRVPDQALAGLLVSRRTDSDPVDDVLRRHAFQRACADLALATGEVVSGQIGDHGVTFLAARKGSARSRRQFLIEIAERAFALSRRFGLGLHWGFSLPDTGLLISDQYRAALGAAESALSRGERQVHASVAAAAQGLGLGELRQELAELFDRQPDRVPAKFERYLEAVAHGSGFRLEATRVHLQVALERMTLGLRAGEGLEERSLRELLDTLGRTEREAQTINDLFTAYRSAVGDLCAALEQPLPAFHDRSLRRARTYIDRHYTEPLRLQTVARAAGFAPNYFSALFKERERVTFERYLRKLRIRRARQLLSSTPLEVRRVAQLSGFSSATYFCRAFKRDVGVTPAEFRSGIKVDR